MRIDEAPEGVGIAEQSMKSNERVLEALIAGSKRLPFSTGAFTGIPEHAMRGTGSCRHAPPAFHAWSARLNMAIWTQRGSSSRPKRLSSKTRSCAAIGFSLLFGRIFHTLRMPHEEVASRSRGP